MLTKFFSRKLFIVIIVLTLSTILKYRGFLSDWPFVVLVLVTTSIYTLVNGMIRVEALRVDTKQFAIDVKNCDEEVGDENRDS